MIASSISAHSQTVPLFINYQGKVTDSAGVGLGTPTPLNRKVIFRIYDAATAGTLLWTEEQTVTLSGGEFSVLLGQGIVFASESRPALDTVFTSSGTGRYLQITVDNGDGTINGSDAAITPRQQITSTAYSFRARSADTVASGSDLTLNNSANYGLGWYGTGRTFGGTAIDGPVLYGLAGGALGSYNGTTQTTALRWNASGQVGLGSPTLSGMDATSKLLLQGDDSTAPPKQLTIRGTTDTNKRLFLGYNTTSNYGALQAYNGASTTTNLVLNPQSGNVGIGEVSPTETLTVRTLTGDATATAKIGLLANGGHKWVMESVSGFGGGFSGAGTATFQIYNTTNSTSGLAITSAGNVGIGTTSPASRLDVNGQLTLANDNSWVTGGIRFRSSNGTVDGGIVQGASGGLFYRAPSNDGAAGHQFVNGGGSATLMTITNAGKVGIGTTTPDAALHVISQGTGNGNNTAAFSAPSIGTHQSHIHYGTTGNWIIRSASTAGTVIMQDAGGNVGIGTGTPTRAKLVVTGSASTTQANGRFMSPASATNDIASNVARNTSIFADNWVGSGQGFFAESDARLKQPLAVSIGNKDLAALMGIEVTNYRYKDQANRGTDLQKKVIAQQLEKVFPLAVSRSTGVIPDIFRKASTSDGWVLLDAGIKVGERISLGSDEHACQVFEVVEVKPGAFRTTKAWEGKQVFVYGREVTDLRVVDYDAISMLNVSATQQIKKEKDAEVKALRNENTDLKARLAALEAKDKARDAKLAAIEKLLSRDAPMARTASLKKTGNGAE